jgi:DNA-binding transcriptional LysR family regulator
MDSRRVRHFLAAMEAGTFHAAAERVALTPQAISKSIQRLEADLGVRLFDREGRRLQPTAYAELLLPHARTIAAEADRFRADLDDMLGGKKGRLRIGSGPSAAADLLARAVLGLVRGQPGVSVEITEGLQDDMAEQLICGKLDLFVAMRRVDRPDPLIREEELCQVSYIVAAGAGHPLAGRTKVGLVELAQARWLAGANLGEVERAIEASLRAAGAPRLRPQLETTSVLFTLGILEGGEHVAILPEPLLAREIRAGRLVRIDVDAEPWTRPLIVATRARGPKGAAVEALIDQLRLATSDVAQLMSG